MKKQIINFVTDNIYYTVNERRKGVNMEQIKRIMVKKNFKGIELVIAETYYEFGTHYVLITNGMPGFHSTDYDRVENYMNSLFGVVE